MPLAESPTSTGKILGSIIGLLLFFGAPLLADFGTTPWIVRRRMTLFSNTGAETYQLIVLVVASAALLIATVAGLVVWRLFFNRFIGQVPKIYTYSAIILGTLALAANLLWRFAQLTIGAGLSFQSPTLSGLAIYIIYAFAHPVLAFFVLRYHWQLLKR